MLFSNLVQNTFEIFPAKIGDNLIFLSVVMLLFFLGFFGFKQSVIYTNVSLESARAIIEKHDGVERTKGESHLKRLIEYMEAQKQVRKTTTAHGCCGSVFSV